MCFDSTPKQYIKVMRILFLGSDDFSTSILKTILKFPKLKVDVLGPLIESRKYDNKPLRTVVVPKIVEYSNKNNIPCSQDINSYKASIVNGKYDMLITASYSAFIHKSIINKFPPNRCINIHPSLLPYYKGAAPIQRTLLDNAKYTGVTIQTLHPDKFDHGKILVQSSPILTRSLYEDIDRPIAWENLYKKNGNLIKNESFFDENDNKARLQPNEDKTGIYFNEKYSSLRNSLTIVATKLVHELFSDDNYECIEASENNKLLIGEEFAYRKMSPKINVLDFDIIWMSKTAADVCYLSTITEEKIYTHFKRNCEKNKLPWVPEKLFLSDLELLDNYIPINKHLEVGMFEIKDGQLIVKCRDNTYLKCGRVRPADKPRFISIGKFEKLIKKHYKQDVLKFDTFDEIIQEYKKLKGTEEDTKVHIPVVEGMLNLKTSLRRKGNILTLSID